MVLSLLTLLLSSSQSVKVESELVFPITHYDRNGKVEWMLNCKEWKQQGDFCFLREATISFPQKGAVIRIPESTYRVEEGRLLFEKLKASLDDGKLQVRAEKGELSVREGHLSMHSCSFKYGKMRGKGKECEVWIEEGEVQLTEGEIEVVK